MSEHGRSKVLQAIVAVVCVLLAGWFGLRGRVGPANPPAQTPARLAGQWDRSPVLSAAEALKRFDIVEGFEISLFAAEPMIEDPVAMAFDEDGRLWVVEMQSYMPNIEGAGELAPTSRVVVLEDTDGDGQADRDTVFLDGLILPRAVMPCYGGALIIEPPNLLFCRDTNGDGRADEKRVLLTGFNGHENPEHAGNALRWGFDNWIHLSQFGIDIFFDGQSARTRRVPAHGQWGQTLDDWGRSYYTPNSESLRGDYVSKHYRYRAGGSSGALRGLYVRVGRDVSVFSARPNTGVNRGYRPGQLRPDGRLASLTAACGPVLYVADAFGDGFYNNAFVCEPAANIVKRLVPRGENGLPQWINAYNDDEFLTSTDERFRPVDAQVGPDGALYICDMYRGVIQHRTYLTSYLADEIRARGLEYPLGLGRIYRITRKGAERHKVQPLSHASNAELVAVLAEPNLTRRLAAQRLLVERRPSDVSDLLRDMLNNAPEPTARVHALRTLEGIGAATSADVIAALADEDERVVFNACELAEVFDPFEMLEPLVAVLDREDRLLRMQAALSIGSLQTEASRDVLVELARSHADDELMRSAVVNSLAGHEVDALSTLLADDDWPGDAHDRAMLSELADAAINADQGVRLLELFVRMAARSPARAEMLITRVAHWQRLDGSARTLTLVREPRGWTELVTASAGRLSDLAARVDRKLHWPGRPEAETTALTTDQRLLLARGAQVYVYCQGCHGASGEGMGTQYPPLAGSPRVLGPPERLARVLLHGLEGPIERRGVVYDDTMPPAPLSDDREFAAVMSYIRSAFGNEAEPVEPALVAQVREKTRGRTRPWTQRELEALPSENQP